MENILFRYHTLHAHVTCFFQNTHFQRLLPSRLATDLAVAHLSQPKVGPLTGLMLIKSGVVSIMTLGQNLRTRCPKLAGHFWWYLGTILSPGGCRRNIFEGYQGILKLFHNPAGDWNPGWGVGRSNVYILNCELWIDQHPPHLNWAVHHSDAKYWLKLKHP